MSRLDGSLYRLAQSGANRTAAPTPWLTARLAGAVALVRRRPFLVLFLAGCVALFVWAFNWHLRDIRRHREGLDFHNYYFIAKGLVAKGSSIYDHRAMVDLARAEIRVNHLPVFVYPPLIIVLFLPLVGLPYASVRVLWLVCNQLFLFASVFGFARIYEARTGVRPSPAYAAGFALLAPAVTSPMMDHNGQGQSNLLVLALVTWALYFNLRPRRSDVLCGLFLAIAILLKIFPGIFVPYLIARRQWRAILWTAVFSAGITLATLAVIPASDYLRFPEVLFGSMYMRQNRPLFGNHSAAAAAQSAMSLLGVESRSAQKLISSAFRFLPYPVLLAVAAREATREPEPRGEPGLVPVLRLSQGFILMGFIMAKWWEHHLVFFLLPYFIAFYALSRRAHGRLVPAALIGASAVVVMSIFHPVLWRFLGRRVQEPILHGLMKCNFIGIVLLAVGIEVLIRRLKSETSGAVVCVPLTSSGKRAEASGHDLLGGFG